MTKERKLQEWRKLHLSKTVLKIKQGKYLNCLPSPRYAEHMECPQGQERVAVKIRTLAQEVAGLDQ